MKDKEYSLESYETGETVSTFTSLATSEYDSLIAKLKRDHRKSKLLYLRSMPVKERKLFKLKHGIKL